MVACFWFKDLPIRAECRRQPSIADEPFVVATPDGVIRASSEQATRFGVRPGQSATSARALCRGLVILPYDRTEYEQAAEPLWDLLAVESSTVEPAEPEICYMEMTGSELLPRIGRLAASIIEVAFMPVSAGVGRSKLVARRAALTAADDSAVAYVAPGDEAKFLTSTRLADVPLDIKLVAELAKLGVETFGDLCRVPRSELVRRFKGIWYRLNRLASGEDDDPVRAAWPPPRIERSHSFDDETELSATVEAALAQCAGAIAAELLDTRYYCRSLTLTVQLADRTYVRETESLNAPTRETAVLLRASLRLLRRLRLEQAVLDLTLAALDIDTGSSVQLALLDDNDSARGLPHERKSSLDAALRYLRRRHGYSAVMPAALLAQARRIGYWTYLLAKLRNERIEVATDAKGEPVRYRRMRRRGRSETYEVQEVVDRWKEAGWQWGSVSETEAYRVVTLPDGTYELCRLDTEWRLRGTCD